MEDLTRNQKLAADIDIRMLDLFEFFDALFEIIDDNEDVREYILMIARAAFGMGYTEAWSEAEPASLFVRHGYMIPKRRVTA